MFNLYYFIYALQVGLFISSVLGNSTETSSTRPIVVTFSISTFSTFTNSSYPAATEILDKLITKNTTTVPVIRDITPTFDRITTVVPETTYEIPLERDTSEFDVTTPSIEEVEDVNKTIIETKTPISPIKLDLTLDTTTVKYLNTSLTEVTTDNTSVAHITPTFKLKLDTTANITELEKEDKTIADVTTVTSTAITDFEVDTTTTFEKVRPTTDDKITETTVANSTTPLGIYTTSTINVTLPSLEPEGENNTLPPEVTKTTVTIASITTALELDNTTSENATMLLTVLSDPPTDRTTISEFTTPLAEEKTKAPPNNPDYTIALGVVISTILLPLLVVICIIFYTYWRCLRQGSYTVNAIDEGIEEAQEAESHL